MTLRFRSAAMIVSASVLLGVATAPSASATVFRLHGTIATAPVWSGTKAVVALESGKGYRIESVDLVTGATQTLATTSRRYEYLELAATPQLLAIHGFEKGCAREGEGCKYQSFEVETDDVLVLAGGSAPQCIAGFGPRSCGQHTYCQSLAPIVATQMEVGVRVCDKAGREQTLITAPATAAQDASGVALPLALAGPWIIGLAPGWTETAPVAHGLEAPLLVERNLATGSEPLRETLPPAQYFRPLYGQDEIPAIAAVQADGQAVFLSRSEDTRQGTPFDDRYALWRVSPTEQPTVIAAPPVNREGRPTDLPGRQIILANGHVALAELEPAPVYGPAIAVYDLQGTQLGRYADATLDGFDFNGTTVLAASTPCTESFLETWTPGEAAPAHPGGRCPAPLISHHITLARGGLRVTLTCPADPPTGCSEPTVYATAHQGSRATVESESPLPDMPPGTTRVATVELSGRERHWLARHRQARLRLRVSVSTIGRFSDSYSERTATVRLGG
jgi:hypothetical protein